VMDFEGPSGGAARAQVVGALGEVSEVEVVPVKEANAAAQRLGVSTINADDLTKVAAELGVSAFIEGNVEREGKNLRVLVRVRNAENGEVVHEEPWVRKKPQLKQIRANFWQVMKPHVLATNAPPKQEPERVEAAPVAPIAKVDEEPEETDEDVDEGPTSRSALHPALIAWLGPKLMWRSLAYTGSTGLSSYKNEVGSPGVNLAVGATYYPGAHWRNDWLSDLGLEFAFEYTVGLSSKQGGEKLSTTAYELDAGAIYRFPLDTFEPRVRAGYLLQTFEVPDSTDLPGVTYSGVRLGAGTLVHVLDSLTFDVDLGYVFVLSTGDIDSAAFATGTTASAFEASGGATYRFGSSGAFGARLGVDFRR
jgi:hypothetical protein